MAYPFPFHRLVISGDLFTERFSTGLNIASGAAAGPVDESLLIALTDVVKVWYPTLGATGNQFINAAQLDEVKVNRIGTNGLYMDPVSFTSDVSPKIPGSSGSTAAPQLTPVVTLGTAFDRGLASKGRMYLPPAAGFLFPAADGRAAAADATRLANSVATLINQVNTAYAAWSGGGDFGGRVAIVSNVGAGAWHFVTHTKTGRVIDTMRSRRSSMEEGYMSNTTAIAGA